MSGLNTADTTNRNVLRKAECELADHSESDRLYSLRRVAARNSVTFDGWHWPKSIQVNANHGQDCIDGRNTVGAATHGCERRFFNVGDVGRHLCPNWNGRNFSDPG